MTSLIPVPSGFLSCATPILHAPQVCYNKVGFFVHTAAVILWNKLPFSTYSDSGS